MNCERKKFGLWYKCFQRGFQNFILPVHVNILRINFFSQSIFGHWVKNFRSFVKIFSTGCQNCILPVHKNICRRIFFSILFGHWSKNSSKFCQKFLCKIVRNAFYVLRNAFFSSSSDIDDDCCALTEKTETEIRKCETDRQFHTFRNQILPTLLIFFGKRLL